jgi:hypothetical protein
MISASTIRSAWSLHAFFIAGSSDVGVIFLPNVLTRSANDNTKKMRNRYLLDRNSERRYYARRKSIISQTAYYSVSVLHEWSASSSSRY